MYEESPPENKSTTTTNNFDGPDRIAGAFTISLKNPGIRYVSSCFSCYRLVSTAVIGWEIYLLHFQYIIICMFDGNLHGNVHGERL